MAMTLLLRRMKVDVTVHGVRSGFRDWSAECTGYAHEVAEMALAHTITNKVERAYRRGDLFDNRRRLMDDWAAFCARDGASGATVTPSARRKPDNVSPSILPAGSGPAMARTPDTGPHHTTTKNRP